MTRSLTGDWTRELPHSKPALYLGYRGGGEVQLKTVLLVSWRHGKNNRNDANIKKDGDENSGCKMVDGVDVNVFVSMESGPHNM